MDSSALDNAITILENEISGLEKYVDGLEVWLWIASLAVVIGVVAEMYFSLHEYLEDRKAWRKGSISSPHRPSIVILILELASVFLVVAGVAGELVVGTMSANANSHLRGKNTRLVSLVRQKATHADDRATSASDEATKASRHEEELEMRTEREIEARLALEKQLLRQGPRGRLLEVLANDERLKSRKGQRVDIWMCRGLNVFDEEKIDMWSRLWSILKNIGWESTQFGEELPCGGDDNLEFFVSRQADTHTRDAARVLASSVGAALVREGRGIRILAYEELRTIPSLDPQAIGVLIFSHPR